MRARCARAPRGLWLGLRRFSLAGGDVGVLPRHHPTHFDPSSGLLLRRAPCGDGAPARGMAPDVAAASRAHGLPEMLPLTWECGSLAALVELLERFYPLVDVRVAALRACADLGPHRSRTALGSIVACLADPSGRVRSEAAATLVELRAAASDPIRPAAAAVAALVRSSDTPTRLAAINALASFEDDALDHREALRSCVQATDEEEKVRVYAARALARLGDTAAADWIEWRKLRRTVARPVTAAPAAGDTEVQVDGAAPSRLTPPGTARPVRH